MNVYYNDNNAYAGQWLCNLVAIGKLPPGCFDDRSILDVRASDLSFYRQCHFFAGIGGWSYALQLAGWPENKEVWTGSCPCQPFSSAGARKGQADERHLWPEFRRLIAERRPATIFGEQVASKDGRLWLNRVRLDLEALGYAVGAADLCAAGLGAPHIRQRLFWVADAESAGQFDRDNQIQTGEKCETKGGGSCERVQVVDVADDCDAGRLADAANSRQPRRNGAARKNGQEITDNCDAGRPEYGAGARFSEGSETAYFRDNKYRRLGTGVKPVAYGIPRSMGRGQPEIRAMAKDARANRKGRIEGYGNAIVAPLAAEFIKAYLEVYNEKTKLEKLTGQAAEE